RIVTAFGSASIPSTEQPIKKKAATAGSAATTSAPSLRRRSDGAPHRRPALTTSQAISMSNWALSCGSGQTRTPGWRRAKPPLYSEEEPTMRAAELIGARTFRLADKPTEEPGPGEVQVRVEAVGVCGSDLHAYSEGAVG